MKPRILILANQKSHNYVSAIEACGGEVTLKYLPDLDLDYDGLVLCGGNDILPAYYGQEINGACNFDIKRDEAEINLTKAFIHTGKPILGICRGMQMLNVILGGTLIQDLDNANFHRAKDGADSVHGVTACGFLSKLYGERFNVNSAHHQALDALGDGLLVSAQCENVIEAIEHRSLPYFGIQFHPERMCGSHKSNKTVDGIKIFEHFIELCKKESV